MLRSTASSSPRVAGRSGIATVEFAMLAPVLVIMIVGMFELGRAIMVKETLNNAARRGCRTAILPGKDNNALITEAKDILKENGIDETKATFTIKVGTEQSDGSINWAVADASSAVRGNFIWVQASIPFSAASWTGSYFLNQASIASEILVMLRQ